MTEPNYDITQKQVATSERSAAARLDRPTEDNLYRLYRDYFKTAEEQRRWNIWENIPWNLAAVSPPADLVAAVLRSYCEDLFLPDYSAQALRVLRASRGRAWFLTRWSYEEGKHLLALSEWLTRTGAYSDLEMRELTAVHLRTFRWVPPDENHFGVLADMLLWELREIERYHEILDLSHAANDGALSVAAERILTDERAHRDFLRSALAICAASYGSELNEAVARLAAAHDFPGGHTALTNMMEISAVS